MTSPSEIQNLLQSTHQQQILAHWDKLSDQSRQQISEQVSQIDFEELNDLYKGKIEVPEVSESAEDVSARAMPPGGMLYKQDIAPETEFYTKAVNLGEDAIKQGRVAAILVAGGQGTRLGFDKPKGLFPIGPVSEASLYQILFEQVLARSRKYGHRIPYFIMTSDATYEDTLSFLEQHHYFGMNKEDVYLFKQGTMPAVDAETGQLLLASQSSLALSPDGHGGILQALAKNGLLEVMKDRGIDLLYYSQVDNPTAIVCDPLFLGAHIMREAEMSAKVVSKRTWDEKVGILVEVDGKIQTIEYSDLPDDVAQKTNENGDLLLSAGSIAIHIFSRSFLDRITSDKGELPFHVAHKKVPHLNKDGEIVKPELPNAYKFERFIFDAFLFAERTMIMETDRDREFNPVKNATGHDSPQTSKQALLSICRNMFTELDVQLDDDVQVEISPLYALDKEELSARLTEIGTPRGRVYLK